LILPAETAFSFVPAARVDRSGSYRLVRELAAAGPARRLRAGVGLHGQLIGFIYASWIHQVMLMAWAPGVIWFCCAQRWGWFLSRPIAGAAVPGRANHERPPGGSATRCMIAILTLGGLPGRVAAVRRRM
jgi:hypothetical protein